MIKAHLKILKKGVEAWNKWRKEHPNIKPDLSGAYLERIHFSGGNFRGVDFGGSHLECLEIERACFKGAVLRGATIQISDCKMCDFSGADLGESKLVRILFEDVNMRNANLVGASLCGATFVRVILAEANLEKIVCAAPDNTPTWFVGDNRVIFDHSDLSDAFFYGGILCRADFSASKLVCANFKGADLQRSNFRDVEAKRALFSNANLSEASLGKAILTGADFAGANLTDTFLANAWLAGANLSGTHLNGTCFEKAVLIRVNFDRASFLLAKLNGAIFSEARLSNAKGLHSCSGITTASWSDASLSKSQQALIIAAFRDSWDDSK